MRGKVICLSTTPQAHGITPAHAGKSTALLRLCWLSGDHPRTCGEKVFLRKFYYFEVGSPPHMRGKEIAVPGLVHAVRITPAHAGKRVWNVYTVLKIKDHPRTCGEKKSAVEAWTVIWGSPPHMRGKAVYSSPVSLLTRITPAHAGKSVWKAGRRGRYQDHPRTCGEKTKKIP